MTDVLQSTLAQQSQLEKERNQLARRRYQKGSLALRGDKWVGRWREDILENGRVRRLNRKEVLGTKSEFPTKRLAQRELDRRLSVINSPTYRARPHATFQEFADRWSATVLPQMKPSTQSAIRSQLRKSLSFFNPLPMQDITALTVQSFIAQSTVSPKTVRNAIATLRSMWNTAKAWGYVIHDPFVGIRLPEAQKRSQRFFSMGEMQQIIATAPEPFKTLFWMAAETGMRAGELAGLTWEDVDVHSSVVRVRQSVWRGKSQTPKSAAGVRTFSISQALTQALMQRAEGRDASVPYVFHTGTGTPVDPGLVVKRKLKPILRKLNIPTEGAGLHAFRHGHETFLDRRNAPVAVRLERLGHSDTRMMVNYSHVISEDDKKIAAELGSILCPVASSTPAASPVNC